jgi:hypothetical protein
MLSTVLHFQADFYRTWMSVSLFLDDYLSNDTHHTRPARTAEGSMLGVSRLCDIINTAALPTRDQMASLIPRPIFMHLSRVIQPREDEAALSLAHVNPLPYMRT